ncbi:MULTISPECIES: Zn-ribbon domain-containing OB-fold protein [Gordonia]|uniref:OB-fold domain-containing protein n=1 Tax=Gordonia amicalis TaxID=89053 RepID=A0ABU4DDM1_9ACTN|nr:MULTISPECIES: OB-fold domain-containing protein [Gordonia]MCR8895985.1 OB-fold domain-containing protein [Gordonia sp. GONU]MCZ4651542.1 OB-fold domain-containing protein [Gordonia amicalis]MDJ0452575.1 OB-fold domain-containing protein [Gordonia amicalis]MDV6307851.1 OB-fold domain-containing protein [Gordonia amicalis]MDV7075126.1 OB-fold domain-containing protein [Gordonia amicalis]
MRNIPSVVDNDYTYWTSGWDDVLRLPFCEACDRWFFPPADTCPQCSGLVGFRDTTGTGTVFTYTVNVQRYNPDLPTPYVIALIELDDQAGLRIPGNVVGCEPDDVKIGMRVGVAFEPATSRDEPNGELFVPVFFPTDSGTGADPDGGDRR